MKINGFNSTEATRIIKCYDRNSNNLIDKTEYGDLLYAVIRDVLNQWRNPKITLKICDSEISNPVELEPKFRLLELGIAMSIIGTLTIISIASFLLYKRLL